MNADCSFNIALTLVSAFMGARSKSFGEGGGLSWVLECLSVEARAQCYVSCVYSEIKVAVCVEFVSVEAEC